jgi:acid phosphatase type 7
VENVAVVSVTRKFATIVLAAIVLASATNGCDSEGTNPPRNSGPPVVAAAGDVADCASEDDDATAKLLGDINGTIVTLGDNAYEDGTSEEFANCYGPTWGRFKDRTRPSPGNHEYHTAGAKGYFGYFGEAAGERGEGYYSYDLGKWHLVALNSNCQKIGGCGVNSPQGRWLRHDLADNRSRCTLAYFHHPLFSSGKYSPGVSQVKPLWEILYSAGADVVLNGHDHNYQRFAPQDPDGKADPRRGIREFVVGTGGKILYPIEDPLPNIQSYNDDSYGVLKLTLRPGGYDWQFLSALGSTFVDAGKHECH